MKIVAASDWRDGIPFESPVVVADFSPGEPSRCAICGVDSDPRPRTELWAIKHRHPKNHDGYVRFYCEQHLPPVAAPPAVVAPARVAPRAERRTAPARADASRSAASRAAAAAERPRALCPDCFVEVPSSGVCGMCGNVVAAPA